MVPYLDGQLRFELMIPGKLKLLIDEDLKGLDPPLKVTYLLSIGACKS